MVTEHIGVRVQGWLLQQVRDGREDDGQLLVDALAGYELRDKADNEAQLRQAAVEQLGVRDEAALRQNNGVALRGASLLGLRKGRAGLYDLLGDVGPGLGLYGQGAGGLVSARCARSKRGRRERQRRG